MRKFKIPLTRAERAFIFFSAETFKAHHLSDPDLEGLQSLYLSTLSQINAKNFYLFEAETITLKFTLPEVCAIYQLAMDTFSDLTYTETITAARAIIWKTHKWISVSHTI